MSLDQGVTGDRPTRIELMIEHYRIARMRRLERRALIMWRKLETRLAIVAHEKSLERVH